MIVSQISLSIETSEAKNINNELTFIQSIWQTVKASGIQNTKYNFFQGYE